VLAQTQQNTHMMTSRQAQKQQQQQVTTTMMTLGGGCTPRFLVVVFCFLVVDISFLVDLCLSVVTDDSIEGKSVDSFEEAEVPLFEVPSLISETLDSVDL